MIQICPDEEQTRLGLPCDDDHSARPGAGSANVPLRDAVDQSDSIQAELGRDPEACTWRWSPTHFSRNKPWVGCGQGLAWRDITSGSVPSQDLAA